MLTKKLILTFLTILLSGYCFVIAKPSEDFCQEDFDKASKGVKELIGARLQEANLSGMDLSGVDLRGAELEKANLQNANLSNANLKNADLEEANLKGANLSGANIQGAELEFAIWTDGRVCAEGSIGGCW